MTIEQVLVNPQRAPAEVVTLLEKFGRDFDEPDLITDS